MAEEKDIIFEVDGFPVRENHYYILKDKEDKSAPSGYVKMGKSKTPGKGINENFYCSFIDGGTLPDPNNPKKSVQNNIYDTGFYPESPMYARMGLTPTQVNARVKKLKATVVKKFEAVRGKGILDHTNKTFWDNYTYTLETDKILRTEDPEDLLTIYLALSGGTAVPKGGKKNGKWKKASYVIADNAKDMKVGEERASIKMDAQVEFVTLLKTEPTTLVNALGFLELNAAISEKSTESSMKMAFRSWIEETNGSVTHARRFLDLVKQMETPQGKEIVNIYPRVKKLYKSGVISREEDGKYYYKEFLLGGDMKTAAENLCKDKDLKTIKESILFDEND